MGQQNFLPPNKEWDNAWWNVKVQPNLPRNGGRSMSGHWEWNKLGEEELQQVKGQAWGRGWAGGAFPGNSAWPLATIAGGSPNVHPRLTWVKGRGQVQASPGVGIAPCQPGQLGTLAPSVPGVGVTGQYFRSPQASPSSHPLGQNGSLPVSQYTHTQPLAGLGKAPPTTAQLTIWAWAWGHCLPGSGEWE